MIVWSSPYVDFCHEKKKWRTQRHSKHKKEPSTGLTARPHVLTFHIHLFSSIVWRCYLSKRSHTSTLPSVFVMKNTPTESQEVQYEEFYGTEVNGVGNIPGLDGLQWPLVSLRIWLADWSNGSLWNQGKRQYEIWNLKVLKLLQDLLIDQDSTWKTEVSHSKLNLPKTLPLR